MNKRERILLKKKYFKRRVKKVVRCYNGRVWLWEGFFHNVRCHTTKELGWDEILSGKYFKRYQTTSTPCSCDICSGEKYSRIKFKKDTKRIISEL